mgnify:CR=1 FL=1
MQSFIKLVLQKCSEISATECDTSLSSRERKGTAGSDELPGLEALDHVGHQQPVRHAVRGVRGALVVVAGAAERGGPRGHARVVGEHEVAEEVVRLPPAQRGRAHATDGARGQLARASSQQGAHQQFALLAGQRRLRCSSRRQMPRLPPRARLPHPPPSSGRSYRPPLSRI